MHVILYVYYIIIGRYSSISTEINDDKMKRDVQEMHWIDDDSELYTGHLLKCRSTEINLIRVKSVRDPMRKSAHCRNA